MSASVLVTVPLLSTSQMRTSQGTAETAVFSSNSASRAVGEEASGLVGTPHANLAQADEQ